MENALTICSMQACESTHIRRNRSGNPSMSLGAVLCVRHWNQLYISGWTYEEMVQRWTPMCWIPNCENSAEVLDHDHSCCTSTIRGRKKRCGRCNRGFICSSCNREIGEIESNRLVLPQKRRIELMQYINHWRNI